MEPKPTCLRHLSLMLYIFFCLVPAVLAAPARKGLLNLRQPDGTIVQAYLTGDENGHLVLTPDGCSLTQDAEGWWCYARYDYYGHRLNTGEHAGAPDTPGEVIAASRHIPYDLLRRRREARIRRSAPLHSRQLARPVPGPLLHLLPVGLRESHQRRWSEDRPLLFQGPVEGRLHLPVRYHRPCHPPARILLLRRQ